MEMGPVVRMATANGRGRGDKGGTPERKKE